MTAPETVSDLVDGGPDPGSGERMYAMVTELFPFTRSITGQGVRATLARVAETIPLTVHEVPSGTEVCDWVVPDEWALREAYISDLDGNRIVDTADSNLHIVSYSIPFHGELSFDELRPHLYTLPEQPALVPYRTSYYSADWGFCLAQDVLDTMPTDQRYRVVVDTRLEPGSLTYGEYVSPGETDTEVLLSTHVCHPSMANDNLSGIALLAELGRILSTVRHHFTYRLVFIPGTIGALTWLSRNSGATDRIKHGLVITGVGAPGPLVYKRTRHGDRFVDRAGAHVVAARKGQTRPYSPWGYDERHYNSPGFDLPIGRLSRTPHGEFPEYHTSADDLDFVDRATLSDTLAAYLEVLDVLEADVSFIKLKPFGEPQLGRRGLYPSVGGRTADNQVMAMLWVLSYSDGGHSLLDIAELSGMTFVEIRQAAMKLETAGLLAPTGDQPLK